MGFIATVKCLIVVIGGWFEIVKMQQLDQCTGEHQVNPQFNPATMPFYDNQKEGKHENEQSSGNKLCFITTLTENVVWAFTFSKQRPLLPKQRSPSEREYVTTSFLKKVEQPPGQSDERTSTLLNVKPTRSSTASLATSNFFHQNQLMIYSLVVKFINIQASKPRSHGICWDVFLCRAAPHRVSRSCL